MNVEKLYKESEQMIRQMSGRIGIILKMEKEELVCQGNLIFCECLERYDQSREEFSKYLSNALHFGLFKYAKREYDNPEVFEIRTDSEQVFDSGQESKINEKIREKLTYNPDYSAIIDATFQNLSRDAEYVKELVLSADVKMPERKYKSTRVTKRKLTEYLRNEGWKIPRIQRAFTEISASLEV